MFEPSKPIQKKMFEPSKTHSKPNRANQGENASHVTLIQQTQPADPRWTQTYNYTDPCRRRQPERENASHVAAVNQADLQREW